MILNVYAATSVYLKRPRPYNALLIMAASCYLGFQATLLAETLVSGTRSRLYMKQLESLPYSKVSEGRSDWGLKMKILWIERTYSTLYVGFFANPAITTTLYLVLIQSRFRVIRKVMSTAWNRVDYGFITITVLICSATIVTFNIILYDGDSPRSTAAAACWNCYVLATDQILSGIFLYKLARVTAFINNDNMDLPPVSRNLPDTPTNGSAHCTAAKEKEGEARVPFLLSRLSKRGTISRGTGRGRRVRRSREQKTIIAALLGISVVSWVLCGLYMASHWGFDDQAGVSNLVYRVSASFSTLQCSFALIFIYAIQALFSPPPREVSQIPSHLPDLPPQRKVLRSDLDSDSDDGDAGTA
ncbi:hypothetical protein HKX48_003223 [Thoreauomyces humboldtii]|nr:hypothetical protein HKX48_003223 [Thoreauomyces humboldtii]